MLKFFPPDFIERQANAFNSLNHWEQSFSQITFILCVFFIVLGGFLALIDCGVRKRKMSKQSGICILIGIAMLYVSTFAEASFAYSNTAGWIMGILLFFAWPLGLVFAYLISLSILFVFLTKFSNRH